ncbi:hypothetical protein [Serpentinicella alkaliphila]|uniref:DUF2007 domain-containing protein n=1 Tax=Serpentinicella alkaliphila TaxID=1734049 RepID=A0A4R2UJI2_9FIRM|nr:hypothetical protein [Serpentinicella alkaliphila]QUH26733.1 hypothetical protein HZR23_14070 [Serpentinicella alkaliphila]TCQ07953.1 hypothetical protein EDD79_100136 [Serpentinicella alkaliphila]
MPRCPECLEEYREGFVTCGVCDSELVSSIAPTNNERIEFDKEIFLLSVGSDSEASIIESQLLLHKIPFLKKYRGAGGYLTISMGRSNFGIDMYVPSSLLESAKEIIGAYNKEELDIQKEDEIESDWEVEHNKKRRIKMLLIMFFIFPGFIWIIFSIV